MLLIIDVVKWKKWCLRNPFHISTPHIPKFCAWGSETKELH